MAEDADALTEAIMDSLEELKPFMAWAADEPMSPEERLELFDKWNKSWQSGGDSVLGIFADEEIVGGTGLHRRGRDDTLEIGYWVRTGQTATGYATEAARILTTAAFEVPGIDVVAIHYDVANVASRRIPEKLGYRLVREVPKETIAPAESGRELQWEITREAWLAR